AHKEGIFRGCGCALSGVGALAIVWALFLAVTCYSADKKAGDENREQWAEYNSHQTEIDSLYDAGVPDSVIEAKYPRPLLRQGGFATIFGGFFALIIIVVALVPLGIGIFLVVKYRRRPEDDFYDEKI
ncbi:MAG: hypothetical protein J6P49_03075, partial [Paludibacteraceae bacterium]|nr:hypothetical protein [Paludibacteraceae bacterium]